MTRYPADRIIAHVNRCLDGIASDDSASDSDAVDLVRVRAHFIYVD